MVLILLTLCCGYFLGRHCGWQEGLAEGKALAPLELRVEALNNGVCPLCQTAFPAAVDCEEIDT